MLGHMLESFIFAFNAVTPMVMLIGLGYLIKKWGIFDANTERRLTKFLFNYAIPAMMFVNVYDMHGIRDLPFNLIGAAVAALAGVVVCGMVLAHFTAERRNQKGVIIQMTYRSNYSVIGLSLASALYGAEGLQMGAALQVPVLTRSDVYMSLYGLTAGHPGVMVVSGTGSMGIGQDAAGQIHAVGGWGRITGDEGSGYWIAREGLRAAMRAADGLEPPTALLDAALEWAGVREPRALIGYLYALGDNIHIKPFRYLYYGLYQHCGFAVVQHRADEAFIYLDYIRVYVVDKRQRRIARAEIIN